MRFFVTVFRSCKPRLTAGPENCSAFGVEGSSFDFAGFNLAVSRERMTELLEQQKSMKKKVNPKSINLLEKCVFPSPLSQLRDMQSLRWDAADYQRREERDGAEEDDGDRPQGQGQDRGHDHGAGSVQERRTGQDVGEGQRVRPPYSYFPSI